MKGAYYFFECREYEERTQKISFSPLESTQAAQELTACVGFSVDSWMVYLGLFI